MNTRNVQGNLKKNSIFLRSVGKNLREEFFLSGIDALLWGSRKPGVN